MRTPPDTETPTPPIGCRRRRQILVRYLLRAADMEMTSAKYPQKEAASQPQSAPSIRSRLLIAPHGSAGIRQARAPHDAHAAFDGRCAVIPTMASADLRSACVDIEKNIDVLLAFALVNINTFQQLPPDDFFVKKNSRAGLYASGVCRGVQRRKRRVTQSRRSNPRVWPQKHNACVCGIGSGAVVSTRPHTHWDCGR